MYSIASWSPSQSEPLTVSYMCHSQLSSDMLPSDAPMPPCAATVCERVGNTLDSTATVSPAAASCSDARIPAPPAPTISASKRRVGSFIDAAPVRNGRRDPAAPRLRRALRRGSRLSPKDADRPSAVSDEQAHHDDLEHQAHAVGLRVIHQDVAHAHPGVPAERRHEQERGDAKCVASEQRPECRVVETAVPQNDAEDQCAVE